MRNEYQCAENCGRRWWYEEATPQAHTCPECSGVLRATGRFSAPTLIEDMHLSERAAKHQVHVVAHAYITHLETRLHHAIVDSGMALDELDKSA